MPKLSVEERALYRELDVPREDWGLPSGLAIAFAHSLVVPSGVHLNKPLRLRWFQIDFLRDVYNPTRPDGKRAVRQAVLSMARRNGKTLLAAVLVLLHLAGPFRRQASTICSAATTRKQAKIVFRYCAQLVRANPMLKAQLKVLSGTSHIVHHADGSIYEAISAEAGGQFGQGLDFVVLDELAQLKTRTLYDALMTSLGSQPEPLMLVISTQAPSDEHILSELIDYGLKVAEGVIDDTSFVCHLHSAPADCNLEDEAAWRAANPALGDYRDMEELRSAIRRAVNLPSEESSVRVLLLNQRVRADAPFLSPGVYEQNAGDFDEGVFYDGRDVYCGIDLSARTDLTAVVFTCEDDQGNWPLLPLIWTPEDTLAQRELRDRAPYVGWATKDFLIPIPGKSIDLDFVAQAIAERTQGTGMNLVRANYDRWRIDLLRQALSRIGVSLPLKEMGQGFKDMSPAVEAFEHLALAAKLRHAGQPVLRWCFANAVVTMDPAGSRKLDRSKAYGRIDAAVAAVMAIAAAKCSGEPVVDVSTLIAGTLTTWPNPTGAPGRSEIAPRESA